MNKVFVTLVLTALACVGCVGPLDHYRVTLDPSLSTAETDALTGALADWSAKTGHQDLFEVQMAPCDVAADRGEPGAICIGHSDDLPADRSAELVKWTDGQGGVIRMSDRASGILPQAAAHELGHAMGLVHTGEGTLMAPMPDEAAPSVTEADVAQWRSVRGL
jgi:predicted Zn-dependent protease